MLEKDVKSRLWILIASLRRQLAVETSAACLFLSFRIYVADKLIPNARAHNVVLASIYLVVRVLVIGYARVSVLSYRYLTGTKCLNLILEIRAKGWKRIIGEPVGRWKQYHKDDWSHDHPTMFSDRLTQLTGIYRHTNHDRSRGQIYSDFKKSYAVYKAPGVVGTSISSLTSEK